MSFCRVGGTRRPHRPAAAAAPPPPPSPAAGKASNPTPGPAPPPDPAPGGQWPWPEPPRGVAGPWRRRGQAGAGAGAPGGEGLPVCDSSGQAQPPLPPPAPRGLSVRRVLRRPRPAVGPRPGGQRDPALRADCGAQRPKWGSPPSLPPPPSLRGRDTWLVGPSGTSQGTLGSHGISEPQFPHLRQVLIRFSAAWCEDPTSEGRESLPILARGRAKPK